MQHTDDKPALLRDLAAKLRLTGAVLGCGGRKDLCARFRAANPATHFDLERSHKWLQGRAVPRSLTVYEDWAKVIGTRKAGSWIAGCSVEAFLEEICGLFDADAGALRRLVEVRGGDSGAPSPASSAAHYLCGHYACYSWAWSPYYRGKLIRGSLAIAPGGRAPGLAATYTEELLGHAVRFLAPALICGRTLHFDLREQQGMSPLFISLILPGPPASALCGVMSGQPWSDPSRNRLPPVLRRSAFPLSRPTPTGISNPRRVPSRRISSPPVCACPIPRTLTRCYGPFWRGRQAVSIRPVARTKPA
jgi:hypothetical protein